MAIALRTGSAVAWTSGTTIASGSMSLTAGDLIICACSFNPSTLTCTYSKTAGTGAIGTFTNRTKITNGSQGLTVGYCSVTTTGTVTITATANTTVTNGVLAIEVYSGASGVKGGTGGTGSTGTSASLTQNITYANSWCFEAVSLIGNAPSVPTSSTVTVERSVASNISGTTNDLAIGIGSNEAALSAGNFTATMSKGSNVTYSADILEIVQQWTIAAAGGAGGSQSDKVPTNVKGVTVREAATAGKVASSVKSLTVGYSAYVPSFQPDAFQADSFQTGLVVGAPPTPATGSMHEAAAAAVKVTANLKATSGGIHAAVSLIASSVRAGAGHYAVAASPKVATNLKSTSVSEAANAVSRVLTNLAHLTVGVGGSAVATIGGGGTPTAYLFDAVPVQVVTDFSEGVVPVVESTEGVPIQVTDNDMDNTVPVIVSTEGVPVVVKAGRLS